MERWDARSAAWGASGTLSLTAGLSCGLRSGGVLSGSRGPTYEAEAVGRAS